MAIFWYACSSVWQWNLEKIYRNSRRGICLDNKLKELAKLFIIIICALIFSLIITKVTNREFKWWITIGVFLGSYLGSQIFKQKES